MWLYRYLCVLSWFVRRTTVETGVSCVVRHYVADGLNDFQSLLKVISIKNIRHVCEWFSLSRRRTAGEPY